MIKTGSWPPVLFKLTSYLATAVLCKSVLGNFLEPEPYNWWQRWDSLALFPQSSRQHRPAAADSQICGYIFTLLRLMHFHPASSELFSSYFE